MRVAIVGAGVTGLVAGRVLARHGVAVEIFERWPDVAGMASAFEVAPGVLLERYYHHLFQSDAAMIALHDELLPGALEWHASSVGMFARGRIWPFTTALDLLRYSPLPPLDRIRFGMSVLLLQRRSDVERMDDERAVRWLARVSGRRCLDEVWRPLLLGKFGTDADRVPLAWLWSKLVLRRRLRGSTIGQERLGYPRGSFQAICAALADDIRAHGGRIHLDREVVAIAPREGGGHRLACAAPGAYRIGHLEAPADPARTADADVVVLTVAAFIARRLAEWPASIAAGLDDWRYRAALVLLLELPRPLTATYWINVADPGVPALGIVEHTNLVPRERYPAAYVYVSNYVAQDDPLLSMTTDELLAHHAPGLQRISGSFRPGTVMRRWSFRERAAQPIPRAPDRRRILPMASAIHGLYLANTTQIHPEDRGTNYSAELGRRVAELVLEQAARS